MSLMHENHYELGELATGQRACCASMNQSIQHLETTTHKSELAVTLHD